MASWLLAWLTSFTEPAWFMGEETPSHKTSGASGCFSDVFGSLPEGLSLTSMDLEPVKALILQPGSLKVMGTPW